MKRRRVAIVALGLSALLTACQPLPHPFADNRPPPLSPLISPPDAAGVVVAPVRGAPPAAAAALTQAMIDALQRQEVPADAHAANARSYHLGGMVQARPARGHTQVAVHWRLANANGKVIGEASVGGQVAGAAWMAGDGGFAKALAAEAAPILVSAVAGDVPKEHKEAKPTVAIIVTGAPGDGDPSLQRAMGDALRHAGFDLAENQPTKTAADFHLAGRVAVAHPRAGKQHVNIVWVLSGPKGVEIGRVKQANDVPAGSLDHAWGGTAFDVSLAAAGGIVELIQRARLATGS
jgi:hypothetical protein